VIKPFEDMVLDDDPISLCRLSKQFRISDGHLNVVVTLQDQELTLQLANEIQRIPREQL